MPYRISKNSDGTFRVTSPNGVKSAHTSKANAQKQVKLLRALEFNKSFKPRKK